MSSEIIAPGIVKFNIEDKLSKNILKQLKVCSEQDWSSAKTVAEMQIKDPIRNSDILNFSEKFPDLDIILNSEINSVLHKYKLEYMETQIQTLSREMFSALRYTTGSYYKMHCDSSIKSYRTVSCLIYLNPEEYTGGETFFKYFNLNYKPKSPSILIFPSNYIYSHSASPVLSGVKYVLANWYNDLYPINSKGYSFKNISILSKNNLVEINGARYFKIPEGGKLVK